MNSKRKLTLKFVFTLVMLGGLLALSIGHEVAAQADIAATEKDDSEQLQKAFKKAAEEFDVPYRILMAVSYNQTRWHHHNGQPSTSGGYGIMHLTQINQSLMYDARGKGNIDNWSNPGETVNGNTLEKAAELLDVKPDVLKMSRSENIRGGAALLKFYAEEINGELPDNVADWYTAVARYNNSENERLAYDFADQVYATIQEGAELSVEGQHVILHAKNVKPNRTAAPLLYFDGSYKNTGSVDCPVGLGCEYIPAAYEQYSGSIRDYGNYDLANRPEDGLDIRYIVI